MSLIAKVHGGVYRRRVQRLGDELAPLFPRGARVLDVGCGDGLLSSRIAQARPDLEIQGIEVLERPRTFIPVSLFDGRTIPFPAASFDVVLFVDVLHHAVDPLALLREAARVARQAVVLKDHTRDGVLAGPTLRLMDWVGNARHGVALPYNYWSRREWDEAFATLGLAVEAWHSRLRLYPPPARLFFDRSLHFVTRLGVAPSPSAAVLS